MAELKKCPFCGGEANVITYAGPERIVYIECKDCKALMGYPRVVISAMKGKLYFESKTDLIEAWNNRVTEAEIRAKAIDEFAEKLKSDFMDYDIYFIIHANNVMKPDEGFQSFRNMIDDVAEQLKEE